MGDKENRESIAKKIVVFLAMVVITIFAFLWGVIGAFMKEENKKKQRYKDWY